MKVTMIAHTTLSATYPSGVETNVNEWMGFSEPVSYSDFVAEFAGRSCYESWNRPNPKTQANVDYVKHILDSEHYSVLEHASATFYITGVSRSLTHELVRHRHLSFSQRSQRYVDESNSEFVYPPALREDEDFGWALDNATAAIQTAYRDIMTYLTDIRGLPRKQARQAARCILPNMTSTSIVVTGNHRAWRDMIKKRWHVAADKEIQELAGLLITELKNLAPNTYQDIPHRPYGSEE
jgi:thymidylate synthase (FAD)